MRKLTQAQFLEKAKAQHKNRYTYNKAVYINKRTDLVVTCRQHGDFKVNPYRHYFNGVGCPTCTKIQINRTRKAIGTAQHRANTGNFLAMTRKEYFLPVNLVKRANKIHNYKYIYTFPKNYTSLELSKIKITCSKHGIFHQTMKNHLQEQGCPKCGRENAAHSAVSTNEHFIAQAYDIHPMYDYSKTQYTGRRNPIDVICKKHGVFSIIPDRLLSNGGCPYCAGKSNKYMAIKQANLVHKEKYTYRNSFLNISDTDLVVLNTYQDITCPTHGDFTQRFSSHLEGRGCPICGHVNSGFGRNVYKGHKTIFYCILVKGIYKVGITKKPYVEWRYSNEPDKTSIKVVYQQQFFDGADAYNLEKKVLKAFSTFRYKGPRLLKYTGITECINISPVEFIQQQLNYKKEY